MNPMSRVRALVCVVLMLGAAVFFEQRLEAQAQNTGTVSGNVVDVQNRLVANAKITLTEVTSGHEVTTTSNTKGEYLFSNVAIGNYQLKVSAPTFSNLLINDVQVNADANVREDAHLVAGQVDVQVTVEAEGTTLDTRSATIGTMLDKNLVENLPIDGENIVSLAALLPGVTSVNAPTTFTADTGGPTYSVSGSRGNQNLFLFDGQIWNNVFYNTGLNYPARLALEEVSVLLNNYKAQYGRNSGSIFNVLTKRGTNRYHGDIWEYYQNSYFDSADYITGLNPHMISNQFGATIGGPIKRDKAFFFLSYADLRLVDGFAARSTPPTLAELGYDSPGIPHICSLQSLTPGKQCADMSADYGLTGVTVGGSYVRNPIYYNGPVATQSLQTSYNLANGYAPTQSAITSPCVTDLNSSASKKYLPTSEYPVECFDHVALNFVKKYLPLGQNLIQQTTTVSAQPRNDNEGLARVDIALGRHSVDARFFVTNVNDVTSNSVSAGVGVPSASRDLNVAGIYAGNIGDTMVITPNLLNVVRASYKRYTYIISPLDRTTINDLGGIYTQPGPNFLPEFEATNRFTIGSTNSADSRTVTQNFELDESMTWTRGTHSFQFGGQFLNSNYVHRFYTEPHLDAEQQFTGASISDFLSGLLYTLTVGNETNLAAKQLALYTYAQDDWRITPRLTLNLGVRWEIPFMWKEIDGQGTTFVPGYQSVVFPTAPASVVYQGDPGYANTSPPTEYHAVAPRVGFAYDLFGNGRFALRGGFGIFYDSLNANLVGVGEPYHYGAFYSQPAGGFSDPLLGLPAIPNDYVKGQAPQFVLPYTINYADPNLTNPYSEAVNFGFQWHVNKGAMFEANYVGKFGRHQMLPFDQNPSIVDCSGSYYQTNTMYCPQSSTDASNTYAARSLYPGFNYGGQGIVDNASLGSSSYNGLQAIYSQRAVGGLTTYMSYSYSRSIDINSNGMTNTAHVPQPHSLYLERSASDFNATHILNMGWTWKFPKLTSGGRITQALLRDWSWGGIFNARTGNPINIQISGDASYTDERIQRPVLVAGQNPTLPSSRHRAAKVAEWFNVNAFATPAGGTFSTLRRNFLVGPGYLNTNMNVQRMFPLPKWEGANVELRVDAFNLWNTPNLANPNISLSSSTANQVVTPFGAVSATVGTNNSIGSNGRRMQFAFILRY